MCILDAFNNFELTLCTCVLLVPYFMNKLNWHLSGGKYTCMHPCTFGGRLQMFVLFHWNFPFFFFDFSRQDLCSLMLDFPFNVLGLWAFFSPVFLLSIELNFWCCACLGESSAKNGYPLGLFWEFHIWSLNPLGVD